jgi:Zn-dependent protease
VTQPPGPQPEPPYGTPPPEPTFGSPPQSWVPPQDGVPAQGGMPPQDAAPPRDAVPPQDGAPTYGGPPPYGPAGQPTGRRKLAGRVGTAGAAGAALAGKAGLLGKFFLAFKGLAILVKFKAVISLFLSVGVYAIFYGWKFAVGFVLLLLLHELGHVAVLRHQGVPVSAPMFIPFVGAFVNVKGPQRSVAEEAWSAIAGPVAGSVAAVGVLLWTGVTGSPLLQALAYSAFLINLFNLVPFLPLDGGRVAGALHPAIWWGGMVIAVGLLLWRPSPVLFLVLVLGGLEMWRRWKQRRRGEAGEYYSVEPGTRAAIAAMYVATAALCLYGMHVTYLAKPV